MKKCAYCGRENADDAVSCHECGTQEFRTPPLPCEARPQAGGKAGAILFRLLAAAFVGLVVLGLSLYTAWQQAQNSSVACRQQELTQWYLKKIDQCLTQYVQQFRTSPASLAHLLAMTNGVPPSEPDSLSFDGWHRPFLFSADGTNCLVTSLGRDGKPGGQGLDFDLTNKDRYPKQARPTFRQFLLEMPSLHRMIFDCFFCGALAFVLCLVTVKAPELSWSGLLVLGMKLLATTVGALIVASVITALHIPSGH
jgi:hypothetical protein